MRITRILTLSAAALVGIGLLTAPPASAGTQSIAVDCESGDVDYLTVASGDQITFTLDTVCEGILQDISAGGVTDNASLLLWVSHLADLTGTGGTLSATYSNTDPWLVTYTAGPRSGTDSLVMSVAFRSAIQYRLPAAGASYYMTVPGGGAGPAPWPQAIGRSSKDATCPVTYSPSWAQWPNGGTGGWVCVREYYYSPTLGDWSYRKG